MEKYICKVLIRNIVYKNFIKIKWLKLYSDLWFDRNIYVRYIDWGWIVFYNVYFMYFLFM